jgi:hypothetical protein
MATNPFDRFDAPQANPFDRFDVAAAPVQAAPAPQQPGFLTQLGRSAASLADVTLGGVLPTVVQQVGYPLARLGRSPEQAQAATARVVGAVDQPFGKAFGVADTPEYQQEAGRQLVDFIGQNFQKGAKWIASKTGLPQSDIENYLGTASLAAPKVAPPVARAIRDVAAPTIERATIAAKMPFEKRAQARREAASLKDYARGPQIDAAADAQRLGIALNPVDIEPSAGSRLTAAVAGDKGVEAITNANKNQVRNVVLGELDLPPTTQLNGGAAFDQARAKVAAPYDEVSRLPTIVADDAGRAALDRLRPDETLIGSDKYAQNINAIIDDALAKTGAGLNGAQLLDNVKTLRQRARKTYNNKNADLAALDVADTNLAVANALESMIESNISNPKLLDQFRDARQKMAKTYAYEGATDFNTGMVDVKKLARITSKDNAMTGDIAALGRIAGNFPEAFTNKAASPMAKAISIGRTGAAGTLGGVAGYALGQDYISAAAGTLLGATAGKIGESFAANRMASPGYQAGLTLRDARIPVNQLAASMQPIPQSQAIVPYQAPVEVLGPGEGTYFPNFEMRGEGRAANRVVWDPATKTYRAEFAPEVTPMAPEAPRNMLGYDPNAPVQGQPGAFDIMRQRERDLSMRQGTAAEQQAAAAEAAARRPTGRGVELAFDASGNLVEAPTVGAGGVIGVPSALESAVAKIAGQMQAKTTTKFSTRKTTEGNVVKTIDEFGDEIISRTGPKFKTTGKTTIGESTREPSLFNLTAEEKIAFDKARAGLADVVPGMKTLDDKAVAGRLMDLEWIKQAVIKGNEKARMLEDIAARSNNAALRRDAAIKREELQGTLDALEEQFRKARPVKTGGQGPKTRAFQRNMLRPDDGEIQNALVK